MAYNSKTNYKNERTYLNDLISGGGGNAEWAKKQMKELDAAEAKYGSSSGSGSSSSTASSKTSSSGSSNKSSGSKSSGTPSGFTGSAQGVTTYTKDQEAIKSQMNENSEKWWSATKEEQEQLHAANEALAKLLAGDGGSISYDSELGKWSGTAAEPVEEPKKVVSSSGKSNSSGISSDVKNYTDFVEEEAPTYDNQYEEQIKETVEEILTRDPFSYSYQDDPLYQFYSDYYQRNGDRAMRDTLGELSARTGGLSSSYAGSVAQQSYNDYMQGLNDIVPELYNLAYSMYQDEAEGERANLEMLQALEQGDYTKYLDLLSQYNTDRNFDYGVLSDQIGLNYQRERDEVSDARYDQEWEYTLQQAAQEAASKANGTGTTGTGGTKSTDTTGTTDTSGDTNLYVLANEYAQKGGDPEDFIKFHWKEYGYPSQTAALSGYNVYTTENDWETKSGYNSAYFRQAMTSLGTMLAQGNAEGAISGIESFWSKLNTAQKQQVQELLAQYGYSYEED